MFYRVYTNFVPEYTAIWCMIASLIPPWTDPTRQDHTPSRPKNTLTLQEETRLGHRKGPLVATTGPTTGPPGTQEPKSAPDKQAGSWWLKKSSEISLSEISRFPEV